MIMADITQLLLLAIAQLPPNHPYLTQLSMKPSFLASMQEYLSHSDGTIRRLGMLVAEILSELTVPDAGGAPDSGRKGKGKRDDEVEELEKMLQNLGEDGVPRTEPTMKTRRRLTFGKEIWDGFGQGKEECRRLRALVHFRDGEASAIGEEKKVDGMDEGDWRLLGWDGLDGRPRATENAADEISGSARGRSPSPKSKSKKKPPRPAPDSDDESLSGYSSSAHTSRSPSPTPSYLEEVAKDPMSNTNTREKIQRPVYIIQLIELLRAREEPDKLEVGLKWGESLVRRKRHFGKELGEHAGRRDSDNADMPSRGKFHLPMSGALRAVGPVRLGRI
jgi:telomere length regulation protein